MKVVSAVAGTEGISVTYQRWLNENGKENERFSFFQVFLLFPQSLDIAGIESPQRLDWFENAPTFVRELFEDSRRRSGAF